MPVQQASFFCPQCYQMRLFTRQGANHVLHLLISLFLCGLWVPIWILIAISESSRPYFCTMCGFTNNLRNVQNRVSSGYTPLGVPIKEIRERTAFGKWFYGLSTGTQAILIIGSLFFGFTFLIIIGSSTDNKRNKPQTVVSTYSTPNPVSNYNTPVPVSETPKKSVSKKAKTGKTATIISENANLRDTPNQNGNVLETIAQSSTVEIVKQKGAWFLVKNESSEGWVHGNTIRLDDVSADSMITTTIPTPRVPSSNPSKEPSTNYSTSGSGGYYTGPRGGCYTYTSSGRKRYVDRSLCR